MTSKASLSSLRGAGRIALVAGAGSSFGFMLWVGRHNNSRLLLLLMAAWVLSPFIALLSADLVSKRWSVRTRTVLYSLMLIIPLSSSAIYAYTTLRPPAKLASPYVIVPPFSLLLTGIALPIAAFQSARPSRQSDEPSGTTPSGSTPAGRP
jgi:hypothetical protein